MLCGKWAEGAVFFTVELDEHVVPNLEHIGVILVDKVSGVASTNTVEVDFAVQG